MISRWLLLNCVIALLTTASIQAQDVTLRGVVTDRETGRPLEQANVTLQSIPGNDVSGTATDINGLYQFSSVQSGQYVFYVQYVGYEAHLDTLTISGPENRVINVAMRQGVAEEEVTVTEARIDNVDPGQTRILGVDLRRVPSPGGSGDLAGFLQTQPGVVAAGDRGGQLFIRGGTPSQNLFLMDGSLIYQPFHIVGFFSVFPQEVISKVDLYAGGYNPRYSGRASSVVDVRLKNGNLYDRNWSASISPFLGDMFFETPLVEGSSSLLVSMRGSLIETASQLYPERQPLNFNSQLVKVSNIGQQGTNCSAHILRTYDRGKLDYDSGDFFKWNNFVLGGRCAGVSEGEGVSFADVNFGLTYFSNEAASSDAPGRSANIYKFFADLNLTQYISDDLRLEYGFFTNLTSMNHDIFARFLDVQSGREVFLSSGAHLELIIQLGENLTFEPGVSFSHYMEKFKASVEPRAKLSWEPRGKTGEELHAAFGMYHQAVVGITDYRDVGTSFTAWMPMPDRDRKLESMHAIAGWKQPIGRFLRFSAEGYFKETKNIPVSQWSSIARFSTELAYANGTTIGADFRLNFDHRYFYGGVGYGYSETEYETAQDHFGIWFGEAVQTYRPPHDRRHQFNAQLGFEYRNFTTNISWMYGSGLPFTQPLGFDSFFDYRERPPNVREDYGDPRVLIDRPFRGEMPDFHRLDVSAEQAFQLDRAVVRVSLGVVNAYDWRNIFFYDVYTNRAINQLSFMPYVTLKVGSK